MSRLLHIIIYLGALSFQTVVPAQNKQETACPVVKLEAERLPDLNVPRCGHSIVVANDEVTVIGGHTTNFKPTPTAEYFKDGEWHLVETAFTHDDGFALPLSLVNRHQDRRDRSLIFSLYRSDSNVAPAFGCHDLPPYHLLQDNYRGGRQFAQTT